jgi:gas vesicle protein
MRSKVVTSLFIGAAAGAILALLFAPDKGSETRRKIAEKGADISDDVKDSIKEIMGCVAGVFAKVKDDVSAEEEKGRERVRSYKQQEAISFL